MFYFTQVEHLFPMNMKILKLFHFENLPIKMLKFDPCLILQIFKLSTQPNENFGFINLESILTSTLPTKTNLILIIIA